MICPDCKRKYSSNDAFCTVCGTRLVSEQVAEQQTPVQQTPIQQAPVQQAPIQQTPIQQTPVMADVVPSVPVEPVAPVVEAAPLGETGYAEEKPKKKRSVIGIIFKVITVVIALSTIVSMLFGWLKISTVGEQDGSIEGGKTVIGPIYSERFFEQLENRVDVNEARSDGQNAFLYERMEDGIELAEDMTGMVSIATWVLIAALAVTTLLAVLKLRIGVTLSRIVYIFTFLMGLMMVGFSALYNVLVNKITSVFGIDLMAIREIFSIEVLPSAYAVISLTVVGFIFTLFFKRAIVK